MGLLVKVALAVAALVAASVAASIAFARGAAPIGSGVVTVSTNLGYEGGEAAGTGMVVTPSGEILTNNHVIAGATRITVAVPGTGRRYAARVVGYDVSHDVAVLELRGASNLKTVSAAKGVSLGEKVHAVGNAGGSGSLSTASGRITGIGKTITAGDEQGDSETLTGLLETNAGVIAGDSGGPLLDANAKVVGMVTAASSGGGQAFGFADVAANDAYAIPIGKALRIASTIVSGKRSAAVHIGPTAFLGIQVASSEEASGALIVGVVSGGPAATAGLAEGDLITGVAGKTVASPEAVGAIVSTERPGTRIRVRYLDDLGTHTATVKLGAGPPR